MHELFEMTKTERLHNHDLDAWRLVEMYLHRVDHYLQAIERLKPKKGLLE